MSPGVAELPALPSRRLPALPEKKLRPWYPDRSLMLGLILALIGHAAWVIGFGLDRERPRAPLPAAPELKFKSNPRDAQAADADPRLIWSPVLFSLPTPWGFSRPVVEGRIGARPSAGFRETPPLFLEGPMNAEHVAVGRDWRLGEDVAANLFRVPIPPLERSVFQWPGRTPSPEVELMPEWSGSSFAAMPMPEGWEKAGDHSLEIAAFIQVDDFDRVAHVFLETPSAFPDINRAVERALRNWKLAPGSVARSGRVVFRYAGSPPVPRAAERRAP